MGRKPWQWLTFPDGELCRTSAIMLEVSSTFTRYYLIQVVGAGVSLLELTVPSFLPRPCLLCPDCAREWPTQRASFPISKLSLETFQDVFSFWV